MKAKFLKRNESVKSNKVIVWMEVESKEVFALEKGRTYDIELCDTKLPNMAPSPKDLLKQAQGLISQASEGIPDGMGGVITVLSCDKTRDSDRCVDCLFWDKVAPVGISISKGACLNINSSHYNEIVPLYHWCSSWRSNEKATPEEEVQAIREGIEAVERVKAGKSTIEEELGRPRNEEDKADKIADYSQEKKGVREGVDGEEPNEQGVYKHDGG
jgi:hypothetical protein